MGGAAEFIVKQNALFMSAYKVYSSRIANLSMAKSLLGYRLKSATSTRAAQDEHAASVPLRPQDEGSRES